MRAIHELPPDIAHLLKNIGTSPRLVAHLTLVYDVAVKLNQELNER